MAQSKTLDPLTCTSASEAFKYPLPQVRQFHRSLTSELDEKNARLRTLVGGSYRQLLGTAEMILEMRGNIGVVEERLSRVGEGCGRGVVGGKVGGWGRFVGGKEGRGGEREREMRWVARMKVFGMCGVVVGRLLKRGGYIEGEDGKGRNLVLAAKVLVLSRLLAKSVGDLVIGSSKEDKELVEESRRKLATLRRRLLRAVERTLEKTGGPDDREVLVQALTAYSLATSSGAKDVLRHFLHVRGEAIALAFEADEGQKRERTRVSRALELYTRTLLDVQALVPRRLSEALAALKAKALLKGDAIRELEGLRLDVCERWFGDEILYFTPYIRHDDLEGSLAVETLKGWAKKASEILLQGLIKELERMTEFKTVVDLRTRILEIWIKEGGKAKGFDPSVLLDGLRKVVNGRLVELLESRVSKLDLVGKEIEATLGSWRVGSTDKHESLWDDIMLDMEIRNGAGSFKQGVLARTHGRNDAVSRACIGYQTWRHLVNEIVDVIGQLKKQRWNDDLEDIEDDLTLESRNTLLSTDDPQMLQGRLDKSLKTAYQELYEKIETLLATYGESEDIGHISIYALRIIRDIRAELPQNSSLQSFGLSLVPLLHEKLASTVAAEPIEVISKSFNRKRVAGRALWEGKPELPVQPSPATFKFLHSLVLAMGNLGADIWSPKAVATLKRHLRAELGRRWNSALKTEEKSNKDNRTTTNGDVDSKDHGESDSADTAGAEWQRDVLIQSLFDALVLQGSLKLFDSSAGDDLQTLEKAIDSKVELDGAARKRLQQGAKEYWKGTSLLFGLLA